MRLSKEIHTKVVHPKMMLVGFYLPVRLGVRVSELCIKIHGVGKSIPVQLEGSEFQKVKEKKYAGIQKTTRAVAGTVVVTKRDLPNDNASRFLYTRVVRGCCS